MKSNQCSPVARSCLYGDRDVVAFRICRGQDLAAHARERDPVPNLDLVATAAGDRHAEADDVVVIAARPQNVAEEAAVEAVWRLRWPPSPGSAVKEDSRDRQLPVAVQELSKVAEDAVVDDDGAVAAGATCD